MDGVVGQAGVPAAGEAEPPGLLAFLRWLQALPTSLLRNPGTSSWSWPAGLPSSQETQGDLLPTGVGVHLVRLLSIPSTLCLLRFHTPSPEKLVVCYLSQALQIKTPFLKH